MYFIPIAEKFIELLTENAMIGFTFELEKLARFKNNACSVKSSIIDINTDINYFL